MQPSWRTFLLFGIVAVAAIIIVWIIHRPANSIPSVGATAVPVAATSAGTSVAVVSSPTSAPQVQAPPAQQVLIQCADGVIRATCPAIVTPTQAPTATTVPQPSATNTSVPQQPKATDPPTFPPAQAQTNEIEKDCTYPTPCTIPTPGANQAVLIHGAILKTDPLNCHYQIFPSGTPVHASYDGTYRAFTITGTQDQINAKIREHLNGLGSSCTSVG